MGTLKTHDEYVAALRRFTYVQERRFQRWYDRMGEACATGTDWLAMRERANAILTSAPAVYRPVLTWLAYTWIEGSRHYGRTREQIDAAVKAAAEQESREYERWVVDCARSGQLHKLCQVAMFSNQVYLPADCKEILTRHGISYAASL